MNVVIDAQLIHAYYRETVQGADARCTCPTAKVIDRLGISDNVFLDSGSHIETEWRELVDPTWFDAWFGDLIANRHAEIVDAQTCKDLLKKLRADFGFPADSGDKWYIRTAKTVADERMSEVVLVTEDMHFHEPKKGAVSGEQREKILRQCSGRMAKYLKKNERIFVCCAAEHPEL